MHHLLRVADLASEGLLDLLDAARRAKADREAFLGSGAGKTVAVLFEKPSLRTRFSVEVAVVRCGAHPIGAYDANVGLGSREPLADAAAVVGRYVDAICMRTFAHGRLVELAESADVPVVNALSDDHHPLQALADLLTVAEACCTGDVRGLKGIRIAYVGDGNNVAHSLIEACTLTGTELAVATPPGHAPDPAIASWARERGAALELTEDPSEAASGAQAVYTDVWASMGQEAEAEARRETFERYRVTPELMDRAAPGAVFLHCLPAHRGEEVTAEVIDGPASVVFDQAENRLHTATAVFAEVLGGR